MSSTAIVHMQPHIPTLYVNENSHNFLCYKLILKESAGIGNSHQYTHSRQCNNKSCVPFFKGQITDTACYYDINKMVKYGTSKPYLIVLKISTTRFGVQVSGASHSHISELRTTLENQFTKLKGRYKNNNV